MSKSPTSKSSLEPPSRALAIVTPAPIMGPEQAGARRAGGAAQVAGAVGGPWRTAKLADDDRDFSGDFSEALDRSRHYLVSRFTLGLSPVAVAEAYFDWWVHLLNLPGKQLQLIEKAARKWARLSRYVMTCSIRPEGARPCIEPLEQDNRFRAEPWQAFPFNVIHQAFLLQQQWWHVATTDVRGMSKKHEAQVNFSIRQALDIVSPSNFLLTNPEVLQKILADGGFNLVRGFWNFLEDWERALNGRPPVGADAFKVGQNVAVTPGKVIFRNQLMELIQYTPATPTVHPEPILIVPAWIMKYYILDLSPGNSLVQFLVKQGFTVFMVSWKNPDVEDRDVGLDDYRRLGVEAALDVIGKVVPNRPIHGVGYCLGGTLLAIAAAALARNGTGPFKTLSFLAAQTDFSEAGELTLFITPSEVAFLEDMMWEQGYLETHQMAGAFQMLHSNDLVWSRLVHDYLMGERRPIFDLMAWNADATRLPARMHSDYLRQLFLNNDLAEGRFRVDGRPIALTDIRTPIFAVGTESDHVAPWRSVYKFHLLMDTSVTFLLTNGGHNGGIVSEPGHKGRRYQIRTKEEIDRYFDPDTWLTETPVQTGSWWPDWTAWLKGFSDAAVAAPVTGAPGLGVVPIADAPGTYVLKS